MKLSELSTDQAADVLCELAPSLSEIIGDDEVISAFSAAMPKKEKEKKAEQDFFAAGMRFAGGISSVSSILIKKHRGGVYRILSVLSEKSVEEIAGQPVGETVKQIKNALQDADLLSFFKSSAQPEQTAQSAPSAPSPGSE